MIKTRKILRSIICRNVTLYFLLALGLRIIYCLFFTSENSIAIEDQAMYRELARNIADFGPLAIHPERVPGYPVFLYVLLTIFDDKWFMVLATQALIDSFTCLLIGKLTEIFSPESKFIAISLSVINLNMIILTGMLLTDTLFLFLITIALYLSLSIYKEPTTANILSSALFLGFATLVRPISFGLYPLLLVMVVASLLLNRVSFPRIALLSCLSFAAFTLVLSPILVRNYNEYGTFSITSQSGGHAIGWVVPAVYQYSGMGDYTEGQKLAQAKLNKTNYSHLFAEKSVNPFEESEFKLSVAKSILLEDFGWNPIIKAWFTGLLVNLTVPSVAFMPKFRELEHPSFYLTEGHGFIEKLLNYMSNSSGLFYLSILALGTLASLLFLVLSLVGIGTVVRNLSKSKDWCLLISVIYLVLIIGYFMLITGPIIGSKYRLPVEPIMTIFSSIALGRILQQLTRFTFLGRSSAFK
jgi:hypothetical protein